jgi:NAD(P)H dehydrogenase (quinone)
MEKIKTAVIYYSSTGANYQMAQWAVEGAEQTGAESRIRKVQELASEKVIAANPAWKKHADRAKDVAVATLEDLEWADVIVFSAPTRHGNLPAQMKQFLDLTEPLVAAGKLANKVATGMSSARYPHGGQEATILSLYTTLYHWGAIVVAPGYTNPISSSTGENPYGASPSVDDNGNMKDNVKEAVLHQTKRAINIARWIHNGSRNNESVTREEYHDQLVKS